MRILTCDEVRQAEREAISRPGMSILVLMQRAGYAVAQFCLSHFKFNSVCLVCGIGRNGGNGLAAAVSLQGIAPRVSVVILAKEASALTPDAAAMCSRLTDAPIWVDTAAEFATDEAVQEALRADLILDAVGDADFKPSLPDLARRAVQAINDALGIVVSVDAPSGVDADSRSPLYERGDDLVFAQGIITFIAPRPAHVFGELTSGPIAVSEIGVQPVLVPAQTGLQVITGQEVAIAFPPRPVNAQKGDFGRVLVVAGSMGKPGSAALAAIGALRAGAGLVAVACPNSIRATVASFAPELMIEGLPETAEGTVSVEAGSKIDALLEGKDMIVLGPGLSCNSETGEFVRTLVARCPLPLVLNADGLHAFAGNASALVTRGETTPLRILTPDPSEAADLLGLSTTQVQANRVEAAQRLAKEANSCVVLKGWRTVVAGPSGETWINLSGNPALAKSGSGDVLSGIIGAALARQTLPVPRRAPGPGASESDQSHNSMQLTSGADQPKQFAERQLRGSSAQIAAFLQDIRVAAAVHLHGLAADSARDCAHENSVLASDLLTKLAEAFLECEGQVARGVFYLQK
jgi:NAD(P)H-hydrate epimerase